MRLVPDLPARPGCLPLRRVHCGVRRPGADDPARRCALGGAGGPEWLGNLLRARREWLAGAGPRGSGAARLVPIPVPGSQGGGSDDSIAGIASRISSASSISSSVGAPKLVPTSSMMRRSAAVTAA